MQKEIVKSGIMGAGFAASFHYNSIKEVFGTSPEVVGVYTEAGDDARAFADARGVRAFASREELFDAVDLVHVCTPVSSHEEITVAALDAGKHVICEKPLTGYCGDGAEDFNGDTLSKELAFEKAMQSVQRMLDAEQRSTGRIFYAENWVYAPSIQKEREVIEKTGAQILWMHGEQAHNGSLSPAYAYWKESGGGVMLGKGCHPLSAALYLKRVEGRTRDGHPILPKSVTARTHALTRMPTFRDEGHIRRDYHDIDDFSLMHVEFEDGCLATIMASDIILGGVHNWLEVAANNHRTVCNINPNTAMQTYNPVDANFKNIYTVEKACTKQGWSFPSPDENWFAGYRQELEAFYRAAVTGEPVESDSGLAATTLSTIYSAYLSAERRGVETSITTF
jgi:predicted dehydrogenase